MKQKPLSTLQVCKRLMQYARPFRLHIVLAIIGACVSVTASVLAPYLTGKAIDHIVGPGQVEYRIVLQYIAALIALTLTGSLFQWLVSAATNTLAFSTCADLRETLFRHMHRLPLPYLDSRSGGDMISRIAADIEKIAEGLLQGLTQLFTGVMTIIITIVMMFLIHPILGAIVVVLTPLSLVLATVIAKGSHKMFTKQSEMRGKISGFVEERISGARVVQAFSHEAVSQEEFDRLNQELYECGLRAQIYSSFSNPLTRFVNYVVYAIVGTVGALFTFTSGSMTAGTLTTFLLYANQYTKPFNEITSVIAELQTAIAAARRVFRVLDEMPESDDSALPELPPCNDRVELDHVTFGYNPDKPLIRDFSLDVHSGQIVAIVGPTGCGKTTLINLLMRFYDVDAGCIRVSDTPIESVKRDSLRRNYGMVLQDTWLFGGTIRENILYGNPSATEEEMLRASRLANADPFIRNLPDGYDTILQGNGENLSQGQRQLLCIARIMLTHPPMLILDEATSSIDTRTEMKIQQAFHTMMHGRTCFIVAHRLSTIRDADTILVMRDGNVIEQGTHTELLRRKGFYHDLYYSQFAESESAQES